MKHLPLSNIVVVVVVVAVVVVVVVVGVVLCCYTCKGLSCSISSSSSFLTWLLLPKSQLVDTRQGAVLASGSLVMVSKGGCGLKHLLLSTQHCYTCTDCLRDCNI